MSTKEAMLPYQLRLFSVMSWRAAHLSRKSRWYAAFNRYVELLADKVRALGGDPFSVPATPDGAIPLVPNKPGYGGDGRPDHGDCFGPDEGLEDGSCAAAAAADQHGRSSSGKISALMFDHFGDFEGFVLESFGGRHRRFFSREEAIRKLTDAAWRERHLVTVLTVAPDSRQVHRLLVGGRAPR